MDVDWHQLFVPSRSLLEIFLRGTVVYLVLFVAMRVVPRRTIGAMQPSDLLVIVLIADAVQQAMAGHYESITEGLHLAAVIFGWALAIDFIDARFPQLHLASAGPLLLVRNGRFVEANMKRHNITEDELMEEVRQHGQESVEAVERAFVEGDGRVSIVLRGHPSQKKPPEKRRRQGS